MFAHVLLLLTMSHAPVGANIPERLAYAQEAARSNTEDLGLGGTWESTKNELPKTQAEADALDWPDVWRLLEGVLRETGYKGGPGAEAPAGPNGAPAYYGWPENYEKYLTYTWDFQLGNCKIGYWCRRGKCIDGLWRYMDTHTELSFDPRDVTDVSVNYIGKSTDPTIYLADNNDFDTIEINADDNVFDMNTDDGTNYIFGDPGWLLNPDGKPTWKVDSGRYRFAPSEKHLTTVEIPILGADKASLHGIAYLVARILNGNGGDVKVVN